MRIEISNRANFSGSYDGDTLSLASTLAETEIVNGLSADKTASKDLWSGGTMTYTIVVENDTDIDYLTPAFSDPLDTRLAIVPNSFKVDGSTHPYTVTSNTIEATLPTIAAEDTMVITFDVSIA